MRRFGSVVLVDPRGWVLLQERDEHPRIDPDTWGFCGGHLEDGEEPVAGALRELAEETDVVLTAADLRPVVETPVEHVDTPGVVDRAWVYAAATTLADADIAQGEGRRIVFVDPARVPGLRLSTLARLVLPGFLGSPLHADLAAEAALRRPRS